MATMLDINHSSVENTTGYISAGELATKIETYNNALILSEVSIIMRLHIIHFFYLVRQIIIFRQFQCQNILCPEYV